MYPIYILFLHCLYYSTHGLFRLIAPKSINQPPDPPSSRIRYFPLLQVLLVDISAPSGLSNQFLGLISGSLSIVRCARQALGGE